MKYGIFGNHIRIDASTLCQLRCPVCFQARDEVGIMGRGYLRFNDFRKFVDENPRFKNIELASSGEIFLNPELAKILKYAYEKRINLTALNGVNLNTVSEEMLENLIRYQFRFMTVSIDGSTNQTYRIYRIGGDFDTVIGNIRKINYYKKKYKSDFPRLRWQFIIFGHNEHELSAARRMAGELNMDFQAKFNWEPAYSPVRNKELVKKETGAVSEQKTGLVYFPLCFQFWAAPQISWDGKLLGCCVNKSVNFGNVFESGLAKCLKDKRYIHTKHALLNGKDPGNGLPCRFCSVYQSIPSINNPLRLLKSILPFISRRIQAGIIKNQELPKRS